MRECRSMHVVYHRPRKSKRGSQPLVLLEDSDFSIVVKIRIDGPTSAGLPFAGSSFRAMRGV